MSNNCATNGRPWSDPTSWEEVCRRASRRRHDNAVRKFRARFRSRVLVELMFVKAGTRKRIMGGWTYQGMQAYLARELGVNWSTVCRDLAFLLDQSFRQSDPKQRDVP